MCRCLTALFVLLVSCVCVYSQNVDTELLAKNAKGDLRITVLDESNIVLTALYDDFIMAEFKRQKVPHLQALLNSKRPPPWWSWEFHNNFDYANLLLDYRPYFAKMLQRSNDYAFDHAPLQPRSFGYWLNSTGQAAVPNLKTSDSIRVNSATVAHYVFLELPAPLRNGTHVLTLPSGDAVSFSYDAKKTISGLYKFNQLGFSPRAQEKYIYLGAWRGSAGAMDLSAYENARLTLHKESDDAVVFSCPLRKRMDDVSYSDLHIPYTGEVVLEAALGAFSTPGIYYCYVPGIGRSDTFRIGEEALADAFYIHMRGLYHKRCGCAKIEPYTAWTCGPCHMKTIRHTFPPNDGHYTAPKEGVERDYGFFDMTGKPVSVNHFKLIAQNCPKTPEVLDVHGGWHDAADYDRRPFHFAIVRQLLAVYMLFPDHFYDGQLDIPESGNGLPDILDEVLHAMNMWRSAQQENGGVGTWLEATSHPKISNPAIDNQPYYLALATRESTLEYCAHAGMMALALRQSGDTARCVLFTESALRAYTFAMDPANRAEVYYNYAGGSTSQRIVYRESMSLPDESFFRAGLNLYLLTNEPDYLRKVLKKSAVYQRQVNDIGGSLDPWAYIELGIFADTQLKMPSIASTYRQRIVAMAKVWEGYLNKSYPYRVPWYPPNHHFVSHMSWGNVLPLKRCIYFLLAYKFTGHRHYRDAAYLCVDFHNGGNPRGVTHTSGLGRIYPTHFLDLPSYADGIDEFVPGITPYMFTFGISPTDADRVHGLYYDPRGDHQFVGGYRVLLPESIVHGDVSNKWALREQYDLVWPIWRRAVNVEAHTVPNSEYTVWETISPAAAITGALMASHAKTSGDYRNKRPAKKVCQLPGFAPLP